MTENDEKSLIEECKKNPEAFGRVYDAHFQTIFNYILYRTGSVTLAQDLTAQTFFNALNNIGNFRFRGISINAWLYRIATNEVNGHFRKQKRRSFTAIDTLSENLTDDGDRPDQEVEKAEEVLRKKKLFRLLHQCIQELKPLEQALVTMRYFERKPYAEIAEALGHREQTLRMRNSRLLKKLKKILMTKGFDHERIRDASIQHTQTGTNSNVISAKSSQEPIKLRSIRQGRL
jgi:RNA polymerase sigma-70 factor (ECF subfamily)